MPDPDWNLDENSKELIKTNHDAIVKIATDMDWVKKILGEIKDTVEDLSERVQRLENFKSKLIGVAVGVSTVVSLAVAVVFRVIG